MLDDLVPVHLLPQKRPGPWTREEYEALEAFGDDTPAFWNRSPASVAVALAKLKAADDMEEFLRNKPTTAQIEELRIAMARGLTSEERKFYGQFDGVDFFMRKSDHPRAWVQWTPEEDRYLATEYSNEEVAAVLGRSVNAIRMRRDRWLSTKPEEVARAYRETWYPPVETPKEIKRAPRKDFWKETMEGVWA